GFWGIRASGRGVEHLGGVQGGDQHLNLLLVLRADDPSLFSKDLVFGGANLIGDYIPLYIGFLRFAYHLSGDLSTGYKAMVFPLTLLYLFGAYLVFLRFSRVAWVAVTLAAFSSLPLGIVLADEIFGLGPLELMVARTILTAVLPLLFLVYCDWTDTPWKLLALFLCIGLLANLHPVSAMDIAAILGIVYLLEHRGDSRSWGVLLGMVAAALVGAAPIVRNQLHHAASQAAMTAQFGSGAAAQVALERLGFIRFPPRSLSAFPVGIASGLSLGVLVISVIPVLRGWRRESGPGGLFLRLGAALSMAYVLFPEVKLLATLPVVLFLLPHQDASLREERLAVYFSLAVFWLTMGELLVFQFGPSGINRPLLAVMATRVARFAVFGVFLLLALAVRLLDWRRVHGMVKVACVLLLIFAAFWQVRHTFRTYLRPRGVAAAADLAALAQWARNDSGPEDLFLFDSATFRVMARRSLVFATKDGDAVAASRPDRAGAWLERLATLRAAGSNAAALFEAGVRYGAEYVVVPAQAVRATTAVQSHLRYQNATYAVLATGQKPPDNRSEMRGGPS
ncbi:MAG TPA: hypothetical protein VN203_15450, partial [Candidatus Acidoferrum sp.]|nr:hypothetical protein [Candidatus Acidoferrum sp.]